MRQRLKSADFASRDQWLPLVKGDIVEVIAPGSACSRSELEGGLRFIEGLGLVPRVQAGLFSGKNPLFAAPDHVRFRHLKNALLASDSRAIWCLRGGYGCIRLLHELNRLKKPRQMKLLFGYSDITTLHVFLNFFWSWPTVHGPLLDRFGGQRNSVAESKAMQGLLFGSVEETVFRHLKPMNKAAKKIKSLSSTVSGGNVAVLQSTLGTPWQVNPEEKILFLEDIGEKAHRLDRMLIHMQQSGYLHKVKAVILGDFIHANPQDQRRLFPLALNGFAEALNVPVFKGLKAGHGKVQMPLPFFWPARIAKHQNEFRLSIRSEFAE